MWTRGPALYNSRETDPFYSSVVLLVHGNGANGGTAFPDSSPLALTATAVGGVTTATDANAFLGSSISFASGSPANYVEYSTGAFLGSTSSPFTVECFVDLSSVIGSGYVNGANNFLRLTSAGAKVLELATNFSNTLILSDTGNHQVSVANYLARMHIAVCRDGSGAGAWYVNGVLQPAGPASSTTYDFDKIRIGNSSAYLATNSNGGFISEIRITKALRYTGAFTPPTSSFVEG
jgi:hypothetical protein